MDNNEISLKDLILIIKEYCYEIINNWWIVILGSIILSGILCFKAIKTPGTYPAETKFLVEGNESGGGISGILGSLGIRRGDNKSNPFKIIEVGLSKKMAKKILFEKSQCDGGLIANNIIEKYDLDSKWAESEIQFENFKFTTSNEKEFQDIDRKAFLRLVKVIFGTQLNRDDALIRIFRNEDSGIFKYSVNTEYECLSLSLISSAYDNLRKIFEEELLKDKLQTLKVFENKRDSLKQILDSRVKQYAVFQDQSRGLISKEVEYQADRLLIEIEGLTSAYTQVVQNYELTDITVRDSKPTFLIIDKPYPPLGRAGPSIILNIIIGIVLGCFISITFIIGRRFYRDIMK